MANSFQKYKIAVVGESWGAEEARAQAPFVGWSGQELTRMLTEAGIYRSQCLLTNVFNFHPKGNDIDEVCGPKTQALGGYPALKGSRYVREEFIPEIERLGDELCEANPNVIIALGNTAMWALLGKTAISKFRGVAELSTHTAKGFKVVPTYHPAAVIRQVELRPTVVIDFQKALRESETPGLNRQSRLIHIPETIEDLHEYDRSVLQSSIRIAVDIETAGRQITCVGFSPSRDSAIVVPFYDARRKERTYWKTNSDLKLAWEFVRGVLERPVEKTFQNGLYDITFLFRAAGLRTYGASHDTMLLHHALQPEAPKALGFLGSIYTDEGAWKQNRGKTFTIKKDE